MGVKIAFRGIGCITEDALERNHRHSLSLGLPLIAYDKARNGKIVAAVGGGPSINGHIDELRAWEGPIWAVNATQRWCAELDIECSAYVLDPQPDAGQFVRGAERALVGTGVDPSTIEALEGAEITLFDTGPKTGVTAFGTAITAAPTLSAMMGYSGIRFFGCDSSYGETTHAYFHWHNPSMLKVRCGEETFITEPALLMQAELLQGLIKRVPHYCSETGDGFLGAWVRHGDYEVEQVTAELAAVLTLCDPLEAA